MKTKIATSLLVILVAVSMIAGTTVAYFSHSANVVGNTFTAGTLQMLINGNDADNVSAVWTAPVGWAPGEKFEGKMEFTNPGNVDAHHIYFSFTGNGDTSLMDNIFVTKVIERYDSVTTEDQALSCARQVGNGDAIMTLRELMSTQWYGYDDRNPGNNDNILAGGNKGDYSITFEFTFNPDAGNPLQGKTCGFTLNCNATQNSPTEGMHCFHQQ